jgi:citrate lyase beta subunit
MAGSRTLKLSILADVDDLKKKLDIGSKEVEGFGGKLEKFGKVAAAAFAAAAAAAAAYAGKLAIEGVKAAIEDEAAQKRLALALENVTGATEAQIKAVEDQISKTSLATGVADDKLRPALQRLATATGSVEESQKLLTLALDISAATGKDVETVSNALGKAYEGNTASLARLGIGLSAAEIKTMGLEGAVTQLGQTFGGAAATQANTFEGQIARLKVGFDEAKEAIGAQLLPVIQKLLDYVVNVLIPKFQEAKKAAIDPIVEAFKNNEAALRDLWSFIKTYLVPIFETALVGAIKSVGATIAGIINIIGTVTSKVKELANDVIDAVNKIIRAYNAIPILPNIPTIPNIATSSPTMTGSVPTANLPFGGASIIPPSSGSANAAPVSPKTLVPAPVTTAPKVVASTPSVPVGSTTAISMPTFAQSGVNTTTLAGIAAASGVTINVNAPSAIDEEGFSRAVVSALNTANARGTGGGSSIAFNLL